MLTKNERYVGWVSFFIYRSLVGINDERYPCLTPCNGDTIPRF